MFQVIDGLKIVNASDAASALRRIKPKFGDAAHIELVRFVELAESLIGKSYVCTTCNGDGQVEHDCNCEQCICSTDPCHACEETGKVKLTRYDTFYAPLEQLMVWKSLVEAERK